MSLEYVSGNKSLIQPIVSQNMSLVAPQIRIRVGYFATCITTPQLGTVCGRNVTAWSELLDPNNDPLNLGSASQAFRNTVALPYTMYVLTHAVSLLK